MKRRKLFDFTGNSSENTKVEKRRQMLESICREKLVNIGTFSLDPKAVFGRNCENMVGVTQVPLGIAGPLNIAGTSYLLPLATTEGALVASVNRGCKATFKNGVRVFVEDMGATRGPVFKVNGVKEGLEAVAFIKKEWKILKKIVEGGEKHLKLKDFSWSLAGRNLYLRFIFRTCQAMGMNMATAATERLVLFLEEKLGIELVALSGNFCIDKKPAWLNFIQGRGKRVWAEATIEKERVADILKTTPERIVGVVNKKCLLGSALAGSLGFNGHFANILAALFIATGQDPAHVVEGSLGITTAEVLEDGDLYFSCYLPDLMVGTVGGGTHLATQREAFSILGISQMKSGEEIKFAKIIAGAVLAGELSLLAALSAHHLAKAHEKLGRGKR